MAYEVIAQRIAGKGYPSARWVGEDRDTYKFVMRMYLDEAYRDQWRVIKWMSAGYGRVNAWHVLTEIDANGVETWRRLDDDQRMAASSTERHARLYYQPVGWRGDDQFTSRVHV